MVLVTDCPFLSAIIDLCESRFWSGEVACARCGLGFADSGHGKARFQASASAAVVPTSRHNQQTNYDRTIFLAVSNRAQCIARAPACSEGVDGGKSRCRRATRRRPHLAPSGVAGGSSAFDTIARRKLIEDQNSILELSGRVQELQNEANCMNDSKDFQDAESIRSGNSHVTSRPVSFPPHPIPEGMLRPSFVSPRRKEGPPSIWDTHGISGNVFADPPASSSAPYPQELHQWNSSIEEPLHSSTVEKSERPERDQDPRCQSGPSAKDSVIFSGADSSKNYGADQQRLQISDLHFDKFPTPATFACWKIRFKTEVCTCSQFPTEAIQWIKEVELVNSVDELIKIFVIYSWYSNAEF